MKNTLISIVTPVYNCEDYIKECVDSILNQTYINFEYFVINDGSTDNTLKILNSYNDDRLKVISQKNQGQSVALNYGWSLCKGDYLCYLSADDIFYKDFLLKSLDFINSNKGFSVYYCDYNLINSTSEIIRKFTTKDFSEKIMLIDLVCFPGPGAIFSNINFKKLGGWDKSLKYLPDFEFWLRMLQNGPFIRQPNCLAGYRIHSQSNHVKIVSIEQANEMFNVMLDFWSFSRLSVDIKYMKKSLSMSALLTAKVHIKSERILLGLKYIIRSLNYDKMKLFSVSFYRSIMSSFYRLFYRRLFFKK